MRGEVTGEVRSDVGGCDGDCRAGCDECCWFKVDWVGVGWENVVEVENEAAGGDNTAGERMDVDVAAGLSFGSSTGFRWVDEKGRFVGWLE